MSMSQEHNRGTTVITLDDIVVERKVPFNDEGSTALRKLRATLEEELSEDIGHKVVLPFPSVIHLVLIDYARMRGINLDNTKPS